MKQTINPDKIQELKELDDDGEVLKELINLYLPSTELKLSKLPGMTSQSDIKMMAHEMRSSCANLGAEVLSDLATQLEYLQLDDKYQANAQLIIGNMKTEFVEVKKILETYL